MLMVLAALLLSIGIASAELNYILPDSNKSAWDYIETTVDGQTTRGFVPAGCLTIYGD